MTNRPTPTTPPHAGKSGADRPAGRIRPHVRVESEVLDAGVHLLHLLGPLTDAGRELVIRAVARALDGGAVDIVLDMSGVPSVTPAGAAACVVAAGLLHERGGGSIAIVGPNAKVRKSLQTIGIDALLHVDHDLGAARRHLVRSRAFRAPIAGI